MKDVILEFKITLCICQVQLFIFSVFFFLLQFLICTYSSLSQTELHLQKIPLQHCSFGQNYKNIKINTQQEYNCKNIKINTQQEGIQM